MKSKYTRSKLYLSCYRILTFLALPGRLRHRNLVFVRDSKNPLAAIFEKYGSDKGSIKNNVRHNYHLWYELFFSHRAEMVTGVMEIGIGTNKNDFQSTMGPKGISGASLRAFKNYFPNASIVGLDIDDEILFNEERIITYWVDQQNKESLRKVSSQLIEEGLEMDLIVDDGLHTELAARNTLEETFILLKKDGIYVIEDIPLRKVSRYLKLTKSFGSQAYLFGGQSQKNHKLYSDNNILFIIK
jgi:hypothetical protein